MIVNKKVPECPDCGGCSWTVSYMGACVWVNPARENPYDKADVEEPQHQYTEVICVMCDWEADGMLAQNILDIVEDYEGRKKNGR